MGDTAVLDDERTVKIGMVQDVHVGDILEVYGDIALGKVEQNIEEKL